MALILSIETSTAVCSVALHEKGQLVSIMEIHQSNVHAQKLMPLIDQLFSQVEMELKNIEAVAVAAGPGSYTGLRIGISIAKGFAYALDIPILGIDPLVALAHQVVPFCKENDFIIPMIDARRMEVYTGIFDGTGKQLIESKPLVVEENPFLSYLDNRTVYFLGDGSGKLKEVLRHEHSVFLPYLNTSSSFGEIAYLKYLDSEFENLAYFEPNYLKDFRFIKSTKNPLLA